MYFAIDFIHIHEAEYKIKTNNWLQIYNHSDKKNIKILEDMKYIAYDIMPLHFQNGIE